MRNLKQFKALIKKYKSIRLKDINCLFGYSSEDIANYLTGFGSKASCSLCRDKDGFIIDCIDCVYAKSVRNCKEFHCAKNSNAYTYNAIINAGTSKELFRAFRDRAAHMEEILERLKIKK